MNEVCITIEHVTHGFWDYCGTLCRPDLAMIRNARPKRLYLKEPGGGVFSWRYDWSETRPTRPNDCGACHLVLARLLAEPGNGFRPGGKPPNYTCRVDRGPLGRALCEAL